MDKQNERIIIRIDKELKDSFKVLASDNQMKISTRIKYLMKMDVEGKLIIE